MNINSKSDQTIGDVKNISKTDAANIELQQAIETGKRIPLVICGNLMIGAIAIFLMYKQLPIVLIAGWSALLLFSVLLRAILFTNYRKINEKTLHYWKRDFITASFVSGLVWGSFGVMVEMYDQNYHGIQAFILGGMAATGIVTNTLIRWNYELFIGTMLIPSILYLSLQESQIHHIMALMYTIFMIVLIISAFNYRRIHFENLLLLLLSKRSENELHISKQQLEKAAENMAQAQEISHLGNWEWNIVENTLFWSDEIYRIFGLTPQAFAATYDAFINTVHPADREKLEAAIQKSFEENVPYYVKHRIILPNGRERIVLEQGQLNKDEHGNNLKMIGTVQDITEQEKQKEELSLQADILDSVSDSIFVHAKDGNFIYVNNAACETRGFSKAEFFKMGVTDLDAPDQFSVNEYEQHMQNILKQIDANGTALFEVMHRRKNAAPIPVEIRTRLIKRDEVEYFISIARDMTERKRIQKSLEESELKYRSLVENSLVGVYTSDIQGNIYYVNEAAVKIMEYESVDELMQQNLTTVYKDPNDRVKMIESMKKQGFINNYELELITKKNNSITVLLSAHLDGERLTGTIIDITNEKNSRNELLKLSTTLEQIDDIVMITNKGGIVEYVNEAFVEQTGYTREEALGKKSNILKSGEHDNAFYKELWKTIRSGQSYKNRVINRKKNGDIYYEQKTITPLKNDKDIVIGYVSSAKDITYNMEIEQELEKMARLDNLTGLYNRHSFEAIYEKEIEHAKRYQNTLSLIMLDIDHFKSVNDTYGHDAGDKVLKRLAATVKMIIRKSDVFARWGGEEFLILCPETDKQKAMFLANKIRQEIEVTDFEGVGNVTSSFGVTQYEIGEEKENLFKRVDEALYYAKEHGRNRVETK